MKKAILLILLVPLSSCFLVNDALHGARKDKCEDKCYEQYQLAVKPCQNSLYGQECKEPFEAIYKECLEGCNKSGPNKSRNESNEQRAKREQRNQQYEEHYK